VLAPQVAELIAAGRIAERQRHASAARQAARARCCQPSTWGRATRRIAEGVVRLRAVRRDRHVPASCCA
jgi:hypothetical protein